MHWRGKVVAVLWAYMDESGEHDPDTGLLTRLTVGCAIAANDSWEALEPRWNEVLADAGIAETGFHMTDFEARQGPYEYWDEPKRRDVLGRLLTIASEHVPVFLGCNGLPQNLGPGRAPLRRAYLGNLLKLLTEFDREQSDLLRGEPVTVVLARHNDISPVALAEFFEKFVQRIARHRIVFGGIGNPQELPPLQVADIAAFEFSRTSRQVRREAERYPLLTLAEKAQTFRLMDSTFIYERNEWADGAKQPLWRLSVPVKLPEEPPLEIVTRSEDG
jgi:hypothetical protein